MHAGITIHKYRHLLGTTRRVPTQFSKLQYHIQKQDTWVQYAHSIIKTIPRDEGRGREGYALEVLYQLHPNPRYEQHLTTDLQSVKSLETLGSTSNVAAMHTPPSRWHKANTDLHSSHPCTHNGDHNKSAIRHVPLVIP